MANPQQPEQRRSGRTATTGHNPEKERRVRGRPSGTDKGGKGGGSRSGSGDSRPREQRPPHPD
jgi:hypothetical protein